MDAEFWQQKQQKSPLYKISSYCASYKKVDNGSLRGRQSDSASRKRICLITENLPETGREDQKMPGWYYQPL